MFYFVLEKLEVPDFLSAIDTDWNTGAPSERFQEAMFDIRAKRLWGISSLVLKPRVTRVTFWTTDLGLT